MLQLKIARTLSLGLLLSGVSSVGFSQQLIGTPGGKIVGKDLNISSFSPAIATGMSMKQTPPPHKRPAIPTGTPNGLIAPDVSSSTKPFLSSFYFPTNGYTGSEPPDPDVAVSETHVVVVVNSTIGFYTRSGSQLLLQNSSDFFKSISSVGFQFDPKIVYDAEAKRFIMIYLALDSAGNKSFILTAVSNSANPMSGWKLFNIEATQTEGSSSFWLDYPGLGFDKKSVAFSGNMFGFSNGYNGVQFIAMDKAQLYAGTANLTKFKGPGGTVQLAKQSGSSGDALYGMQAESRSSLRITAITNNGSLAVTQASVPVPTWVNAMDTVAGPDGKGVDTISDGRIFNATWRAGRMVGGHVVGAAGAGSFPAARWYEIKTNNWPITSGAVPTLAQSGNVVAPAGHGHTFPALCLDKNNSIGMTFSKIGSTTAGDVMVAGRRSSDPAGSMGIPVLLEKAKSNTNNNFSDRWGDYFDAELDPNDGLTFWAVGMGPNAQGRWQTYVKTFSVTLPDSSLDNIFPASATVSAGTLVSGDRTRLYSDDSSTFRIQSQPVQGLGQAAGLTANFVLPYTSLDTLRFSYSVASPSAVSGASSVLYALNIKTGQYDQIDTLALSSLRQSRTIEISSAQVSNYVTSAGGVNLIVRSTLPVRNGRMPSSYLLDVDKLIILSAKKP